MNSDLVIMEQFSMLGCRPRENMLRELALYRRPDLRAQDSASTLLRSKVGNPDVPSCGCGPPRPASANLYSLRPGSLVPQPSEMPGKRTCRTDTCMVRVNAMA